MNLFEVQNLEFSSVSEKIIKGISLSIKKGTTNALLGKSGSGKSTLLKLIAGILVPEWGKVFFDGKNIATMSAKENLAFRKRCSFVFQDSALWANQDILSNLALPLQIHYPELNKDKRLEKIKEICEIVGYERSLALRPSDLSTGEQKQIGFARAVICEPEVLFLDECTESLDKRGAKILMDFLHKFVENGNTIIYISHDTGFVKEFPGTSYNIDAGMIKSIEETKKDEI